MNRSLYIEQLPSWPTSGRHVLANFDDESISVYQAYGPSIAGYAAANQKFGGEFSYTRMSWIKPNFLWMMYRSGWASKVGQERILEIRLRRTFFDELLSLAVPSSFDPKRFASHDQWQTAVAQSTVRLQWDPDHDPLGRVVDRRAVQLGLRGEALRRFGQEEVIEITDVTDFVVEQRQLKDADLRKLLMPPERVYVPGTRQAIDAIGLD